MREGVREGLQAAAGGGSVSYARDRLARTGSALAVDAASAGHPAPDAAVVAVREDGVLREALVRNGLGEEGAGRGRVDEARAFALVSGFEVRELASLVAVPGGSRIVGQIYMRFADA